MAEIVTTLGELARADVVLVRLTALKLPAAGAYHLAKLTRLVREESRHFFETRNALVLELGTVVDGVPLVARDSAEWPTFEQRVTELAAVAVTIPFAPLPLTAFGTAEVSADELEALGALVEGPA
jgi:hypothetical protein